MLASLSARTVARPRVTARRATAARRAAPGRAAVAPPQALFGFGQPKAAPGTPYICIDCGYIYKGDFSALPRDYKCPACNVGKSRFKPYSKEGNQGVLAAKKANKEKLRESQKGSKRAAQKAALMEQQAEMDKPKRGLFGRR